MKFLSHDGLLYFWKKIKSYVDTKYNELFQSVSNGKKLVASAITDKGITTDATATFATMASNINNISTGVETYDATASEANVLSGKTFYKDNVKKTGTMPDRRNTLITGVYQATNYTDVGVYNHDSGGNYLQIITRPGSLGYVDNSTQIKTWITGITKEKIQAGVTFGPPGGAQLTGTYTSDATATADKILSGQTAYVNGNKVTGTIPIVNSDVSDHKTTPSIEYGAYSPDDTAPYLYFECHPYHYLNTNWYRGKASDVASKIGLTADKLVTGNTVLGVTGTGSSGKRYVKIESPTGGYLTPDYSQSGKEIHANGWYTYPAYTEYSYRALSYPWTSFIPDGSWTPSVVKITEVKRSGSWDGYIQYTRTATITSSTKIVLWEYKDSPASYSKLMYVWTSETDSNPATVFRSDRIVIPLCAQAGDTSYTTSTFELWE